MKLTFKDIEIFENEIKTTDSVSTFSINLTIFLIFEATYQYPYYSRITIMIMEATKI